MKAMVLAAGLGTRLHPLTLERPKPAVPVLGEPLIAHTLAWLRRWGVDEVVLNLFHLPEVLPRLLGDGSRWHMTLHYVVEKGTIRGTGGGVRGAHEFLDDGEPFVVVNGDILVDLDLGAALNLHRSIGGLATMVLRESDRAAAYGELLVDQSGRVRSLLGRPHSEEPNLRSTMFAGVHVLQPEVLSRLPEQGCIVRQFYRQLLDAGAPVGGYVDPGPWLELGTPRDYLDGNLALATGQVRLSYLSEPSEPAAGQWIAADVQLGGAGLLHGPCVVGAGASVRAPVDHVVVWPGATVDRPLSEAVVTPQRVVRLA
jgi:NDP-sugar pyrophosphorylase family protein